MLVYQRVSRTRTELNIFTLARIHVSWNAQFVARPSPGVDERHAKRLIDLSAQPINVNLYQFREGIERIVPDVFGYFLTPDNFAGIAREVLKQRVLFGREFDSLPVAAD